MSDIPNEVKESMPMSQREQSMPKIADNFLNANKMLPRWDLYAQG